MNVQDTVKFFFGHSQDMIEDEEKKKAIEKVFFSKKQKNNPDFLKKVRERRVSEDKMKNMHMKFKERESLWTEFSSVFKTDQGSLWFFDDMINKLGQERERLLQEQRHAQEKKQKEEMLKKSQMENLKNFDKIGLTNDSDDSDG